MRTFDAEERQQIREFILDRCGVPDGTDCWIWEKGVDADGYGVTTWPTLRDVPRRKWRAHRLAYVVFVGEIPDEAVMDHLCRVRNCINPWHLEPVSVRENTLRSPLAPAAINAQKNECKRGHPLEGDNLYLADGRRHCRQCRRDVRRDAARAQYRKKAGIPLDAPITSGRPRSHPIAEPAR